MRSCWRAEATWTSSSGRCCEAASERASEAEGLLARRSEVGCEEDWTRRDRGLVGRYDDHRHRELAQQVPRDHTEANKLRLGCARGPADHDARGPVGRLHEPILGAGRLDHSHIRKRGEVQFLRGRDDHLANGRDGVRADVRAGPCLEYMHAEDAISGLGEPLRKDEGTAAELVEVEADDPAVCFG
jgi:hypothetical protein